MKYLTVFSDGSYDHRSKMGGYAFFVRDDKTIIKLSFPMKWPVDRSQDVELFAMCHAIQHAVNQLPHMEGDVIVAQTDCLNVIQIFERKSDLGAKSILDLVVSRGLQLRFKHVKAHTGADDRRSWVNRWCDYAAKREQRRARDGQRANSQVVQGV